MSNRNHTFKHGEEYSKKCLKCNKSGYDLYTEYFTKGGKESFESGKAIAFFNKMMPCLTNEEVIIKRLLE